MGFVGVGWNVTPAQTTAHILLPAFWILSIIEFEINPEIVTNIFDFKSV